MEIGGGGGGGGGGLYCSLVLYMVLVHKASKPPKNRQNCFYQLPP